MEINSIDSSTIKVENENANENKSRKTLRIILIILAAIIIIGGITAGVLFYLSQRAANTDADLPTIQIQSLSIDDYKADDSIMLDVTLSEMPNNVLYPAASINIKFDSTKLIFDGITDGNILTLGDDDKMSVPTWAVNAQRANATGEISIMYLDITGGRHAFCDQGFDTDSQNILMRLKFHLRGTIKENDILTLNIKDFCLAADNETETLSMTGRTVKTVDGKIIIK